MLIWMHPFLKLFTSNILTFKSQLHSSPWLWSMFLPVAENGSLCPQQESWVMRFGNHLLHIPSLKNLSPAQCLQTVVLCMLFNCYGCLWSSGLPWLLRWWRIHLQCRRPGSILGGLGGGEIPWRREWLPTPIFLPGESHRQRSLAGYSLWSCKESDLAKWLTLSLHFMSS